MTANGDTVDEVIETFRSIPSLGGATLTDYNEIAYWWATIDRTELRLVDIPSGSSDGISIGDLELEGWEHLVAVNGGIVVNGNPNTYLVDRNGTISPFLQESGYTQIHDVDPSGNRVLYLHYGDPWTLRVYDHSSGKRWIISEEPEQQHHAGFSRNGEFLAYRRNTAHTSGAGSIVVATDEGDQQWEGHIGDKSTDTLLHDWQSTGSNLLVSDRSTATYRVGLYDWRTDESTWLTGSDWPEYGIRFTPDGSRVLAIRHRDGIDIPLMIDVHNGEERHLALPDGIINRSKYATIRRFIDDEVFFLEHESATSPPRLLTYDLRTDEHTVLVETGTNLRKDRSLVDADYVRYDSTDDWEIGAVLYDSGIRPSPAMILIHGGPTTSETRGFDRFAQVLANCGYSVLKPNYRGSTDQGREFEQAIRGDVGGGEVDDIANGAHWLAAQDWIDEDRIAVYGQSHGALNAGLQAVRYPDLYGVVFVSNGYLSFTNDPDDGNTYANRFLIDETRATFGRERNVVERADEIGCPICLVWGSEDYGQDMLDELVARLDDRGWQDGEEYRLEIFEGEGHEIRDKKSLWSLVVEELERRL